MSRHTASLRGGLEIRDVEELRTRLLGLLAGAATLEVDLAGVAAADTAGVQLLLSLKAEAVQRGIELIFSGSSAALDRAVMTLGLEKSLGAGAAHVS